MSSLLQYSATDLVQLIRRKDLSPAELMEQTLDRIEAVNPLINCFTVVRAQEAMDEAKAMTDRIVSGTDLGLLGGIPVAVKDLEDVQGMVTSFGSVPYKDNIAHEDSVQVARLRAAGAIVVGKTNTPEFGFTGFTKNRLFGVTRNPWNLDRTPGGSSGGSAAAVAACTVPIATGSDAGGSIRIPACYSGCFGLKPTYGRIPLGPFSPLYWTHTWTMGPLCRTVEDAALYLDCTAGYHRADPDSLPSPGFSCVRNLRNPPPSLKIAYSASLGYASVQKDILALMEKGLTAFEEMGHHIEIWSGFFPDVAEAWSDLTTLELYAQIKDDLEANRQEMGRALVQALENVSKLPLKTLLTHQRVRSKLNQVLKDIFADYDLFITPTMPTEAFDAKGPPPSEIEGVPIPLLGAVAFTYPFNLSGHPSGTVRLGFTRNGLPAGLQIVGPRYREDLVLQAAYAYSRYRPWNDKWPRIEQNPVPDLPD